MTLWWPLVLSIALISTAAFAQDGRGVSLLAVPDTERARVGFDASASTALFVGVNSFNDPALTSIPFAVDDAVDLAHLFAFELALVLPQKVVLALAGEPAKEDSKARLGELEQAGVRITRATKPNILDSLLQQSKAVGADGLFVVGLATHGFTKAGEDFLFGTDALLAYPRETGIRVPLLFEALADAKTPRRFALLDACKERLGAARGTSQASPMGQAFQDAIAAAQGQVVLAATTTNGFAYDDAERKNGVFTAAVLDGLRGEALDSDDPFVTAGQLADYVNERVINWVSQHRPTAPPSGISRNIEGAGAALPLAADATVLERTRDFQLRREAAITKLRGHLSHPLTGKTFDTVVTFLNVEAPTDAHFELLLEIEELDGSKRARRVLKAYVDNYVSPLVHGAGQVPPVAPVAPRPPPVPAGYVQIIVNVPAAVFIDDVQAGEATPGRPLNKTGIAPGPLELRVEAEGYETQSRTIEVRRGQWEQPVFHLEPVVELARLTVRSNVVQDELYINDEASGPTGPTAHELAPGTYRLRVEKEGYVAFEQTVTLEAGEDRVVGAQLEPRARPREIVRPVEPPVEPRVEPRVEPPQTSRISIEAGQTAENGCVVPIAVDATALGAKRIAIYSGSRRNLALDVNLRSPPAQAYAATRVKMAKSGPLIVDVTTQSGKVLTAESQVRVTIGCRQSSGGAREEPKLKLRAKNGTLKMLASHPMNTKDYLESLTVLADGKRVIYVKTTPWASKNPYFSFKVDPSVAKITVSGRTTGGLSAKQSTDNR